MSRTLFASLAIAASLAGLGVSAPATAAGGAYYQAQLATPTASDRVISKRIVWNCDADNCVATQKSPSRDHIVCTSLVKQVGALESFSVRGEAMSADKLALCNAAAK